MRQIAFLRPFQPKRQRGAALAVALIMLIMVSLLAAAGFLLSTTEARGAVSWSDRQRAMFVAEGVLKEAEDVVKTLVANNSNVEGAVAGKGTGYYIRTTGNVPSMSSWPKDKAVNATSKDQRLEAGSAQYIVVYEGAALPAGDGMLDSAGRLNVASAKHRLTLYAKAGGIREGTYVVLSTSKEF